MDLGRLIALAPKAEEYRSLRTRYPLARAVMVKGFIEHDGPETFEQYNCKGHKFECTGTAYGGDDERYHGEGICYCIYCGLDGDA